MAQVSKLPAIEGGSQRNGTCEYWPARHCLRAREAKRQKYSGGAELVPALQEQLIHVQHVNRKSGLFGPTMLLTGHEGEVFCAEFSPDGRSLATGSFDKCLYLWNVYGECENYGVMKGHANAVLEVHWKHDGTQLYTCSADKSVCVWDIGAGTV
eukprot:g18271.t1